MTGAREAASSRSRKEELRAEGEAGRTVWFFSRWWCECWREGQRVETAGAVHWGPQVSVIESSFESWGQSQPDSGVYGPSWALQRREWSASPRGLLPTGARELGGCPAAVRSLHGHLAGQHLLCGWCVGLVLEMKAGRCVLRGRVQTMGTTRVRGGFRLDVCVCMHVRERGLTHPHSHAHDGANEQLGDRVSRNEQSHPVETRLPG